jgi:radical SAM protein with 4Fe4S-binding SPASM domain
MKKSSLSRFVHKLVGKKEHFPWSGQLELTRRCSLNCVHCYCDVRESRGKELTTEEWKRIIDALQAEGCFRLTITGGDPVVRKDFLELYAYAKSKGFVIILLTNGYSLTKEIVTFLKKTPPLSIEITLNGITPKTYESVTRVKGSFRRVIANIKLLAKSKIKLILKSNCLKQNKHEIVRIKDWVEGLLGKPADNKHRFKYDPMIYPRLDGDKSPCKHRLSCDELADLRKQDPDILREYQAGLHSGIPDFKWDGGALYPCNSWMQEFYVDSYGRLKFCLFSDKFSVDLKTTAFREGFYDLFPRLLSERFKTDSKCRDCSLRPVCYQCPARARLETGNEEEPVPYYCRLAEATARDISLHRKTAH